MTELLRFLPENHPQRARIMKNYLRVMAALQQYQDADGMWPQLADGSDSYQETSCAAMFTYAMITGVNKVGCQKNRMPWRLGGAGWRSRIILMRMATWTRFALAPASKTAASFIWTGREAKVIHTGRHRFYGVPSPCCALNDRTHNPSRYDEKPKPVEKDHPKNLLPSATAGAIGMFMGFWRRNKAGVAKPAA
jgi:hypothetical protein